MTALPRRPGTSARRPAPHPAVIAHRGGAPDEIDNSPEAFAYALAGGVDLLECDVRQTADGHLVLIHDGAVRIDGQRRRVRACDYATLTAALPWLMTFDEFLERFGQAAGIVVDLKASGYERAVRDALLRHGLLDRALVSTVHTRSLRVFAADAPRPQLGLSRGHLVSTAPPGPLRALAARWLRLTLPPLLLANLRLAGADAAMLQHRIVTPSLVRRLHRRGYRVYAWTVDSETEALRLRKAEVDGLASNVPHRIVEALHRDPGDHPGTASLTNGGGRISRP